MRRLGHGIRRHAVLCALSWLCALWMVVDWMLRTGPLCLPDFPVTAMIVLLAVLPGIPVAASLAIAVCGVAFMVFPIPGPDVNWLLSAPVCLALAVLGYRWRSGISVVAVLVIGCMPGLVGTASGAEPLLAVAPSVQMCVMWWCVGAMVGMVGDAERVKSVEVEQSRQREHRLRMLGVLHDSLANDLVGAMLRCRAVASRQSMDATALAEIREVEDILERSLMRLREDIIIPERVALGGGPGSMDSEPGDVMARKVVPETDCASRLAATVSELNRWLKSRGWEGLVRVSGDFTRVDATAVQLTERCVRELGMNMLKYGRPGAFALEAEIDEACVHVFSSNFIRHDAAEQDAGGHDSIPEPETRGYDGDPNVPDFRSDAALSSNCGLSLLRHELEQCGGSLRWTNEAGEWAVYAVIPRHGCDAASQSERRVVLKHGEER